MGSPTLGYVDATHQTLRTHFDRTVLDVLLGSRRRHAGAESETAPRPGLELLEGGHIARPRTRASRHSAMRVQNRHYAHRARNGSPQGRGNLFIRAPSLIKTAGSHPVSNSDLSGFS